MMRVDIMAWISRYTAAAALEGNLLKQKLPELYWLGLERLDRLNYDEALTIFTRGLQLAKDLGETCWELHFDYWIVEVYFFYKIDYKTGLDRAIKTVAYAHKAEYRDCPVQGKIYYAMVEAYYMVDSLGYEAEIREMMRDIDAHFPLDDDTAQRMQYIRASLAFDLEDYVTAESEVQLYLSMCINNSFRIRSGYGLLRDIAYIRGQVQDAFNFAHQETYHAQRAAMHNRHAYALLWQGVYAQRLGQVERASEFIQRGIQIQERYNFLKRSIYYDSLSEYHELCGDLNRALTLREEQVAAAQTVGSPSSDCHARLQYCRFLGRTGRDIQAALQACYHAAQGLRKPDLYLQKLKRLEAGDYYEYDWQKG